ncbi:MAG: dephospho-CoA kinase [Gammaproteobacteria bacterium]|nr:dephospho-CoA kinase [Gammaproteobacteria bacterium]|tara:strand:- start:492 stop:1106 length:615 start_codon:yes stop_codon:yes gene_type:complete
MFVVGLTGGIGSGKSTVAEMFAELDIDLVDADIASREVVAPGTQALAEIAEHFGAELLLEDGRLNRGALRRVIFHQEQEKQWLESLLHPLIKEWLIRQISRSKSPYCMLVSPLLLESGQSELVDRVLVVDVSVNTQVSRTLARDGGDERTARAIIRSQMNRKQRVKQADDIINNELQLRFLGQQIEILHQQYLARAKTKGNNEI